jgi:hypothetical protein
MTDPTISHQSRKMNNLLEDPGAVFASQLVHGLSY